MSLEFCHTKHSYSRTQNQRRQCRRMLAKRKNEEKTLQLEKKLLSFQVEVEDEKRCRRGLVLHWEIYHCPFCNICRVGKGLGINFFHCMNCNLCLSMKKGHKHKCFVRSSEMNCPICCDSLFTSTDPFKALRCGHLMHSACFQAYSCSHYTCPVCCKSMGDMTVYFGMLDALLAAEKLPQEYKNLQQDIVCNDCGKRGKSRFHWLYHKCGFCSSYNTTLTRSLTSNGLGSCGM